MKGTRLKAIFWKNLTKSGYNPNFSLNHVSKRCERRVLPYEARVLLSYWLISPTLVVDLFWLVLLSKAIYFLSSRLKQILSLLTQTDFDLYSLIFLKITILVTLSNPATLRTKNCAKRERDDLVIYKGKHMLKSVKDQ